MKLKKVQIQNFRSIKSEEISFDPQCRVLVGINESGKSNLLDALSLLSDDYEPKLEDEREQLPDETDKYEDPRIDFIFELADNAKTFYDQVLTEIIGGGSSNIVKNGDKSFTIKQYCELFKEGLFTVDVKKKWKYTSHWRMNTTGYELMDGWEKPTSVCPDGYKFGDLDGKNYELKKIALVKPREEWNIPGEYLADVTFEDFHEVFIRKFGEVTKEHLPDVVYWKYSDAQLLPEKINLQNFMNNPDICISLKNMFQLASEIDIKESIEAAEARGPIQLGNLLKRVASQNTDYFKKVWKEYKDIKFSLTMDGEHIKCSVSEKNDFAFQKRSDGFKKFVAFLLTVSTQSQTRSLSNALILIDEPDAGLHPSGARYLRDELIKISETNYVMYSTHSIFMIDRHKIDRHMIITKKGEVTTIKKATEGNVVKEEVIFNAINHSIFEHLKEINILLEGWRDKKLFEVATKSHEAEFFKNIGITRVQGASSYVGLIPTLELAERRALIVSDNDNAAKDSQRKYQKQNYQTEWKRYDEISQSIGAKTGEDFLKKGYLVSKLNSVTEKHKNIVALEESNIPENDRLNYVKQHVKQQLKNSEITDDQKNKIMDEFKTALFNGLTKEKIEARYRTFLNDLKAYIENNLMPSA